MLIEFGMKNYFSFKEGVSISFFLDSNCPKEISKGKDFTPVLCIKGANASGKTNILKGLSFITQFAAHSFAFDPDRLIPLDGFFDSKDATEFYIDFSVKDNKYRYELEATEHKVFRETLYRTQGKKVKIVERTDNDLTLCLKAFNELRTMKLRKNVSLISTARQYGITVLDDWLDFFSGAISNVLLSGTHRPTSIDDIAETLSKDDEIFKFVKKFIKEIDVGVSDIQIIEEIKRNGKKQFYPLFIHTADGKEHAISSHTESSGTKALLANLVDYNLILRKGGLLILDEFDIYLHSHILPKLIDLFALADNNPHSAQLIFTTQNPEIIDTLGRYRTYLVTKEENESFAYRLNEIPGDILRNDRSILPTYNDGKIGGVPKL